MLLVRSASLAAPVDWLNVTRGLDLSWDWLASWFHLLISRQQLWIASESMSLSYSIGFFVHGFRHAWEPPGCDPEMTVSTSRVFIKSPLCGPRSPSFNTQIVPFSKARLTNNVSPIRLIDSKWILHKNHTPSTTTSGHLALWWSGWH